jgi:hypothetical protein
MQRVHGLICIFSNQQCSTEQQFRFKGNNQDQLYMRKYLKCLYIYVSWLLLTYSTVVVRSKAPTTFDCANNGIVGSNPSQDKNIYVHAFFSVCIVLSW